MILVKEQMDLNFGVFPPSIHEQGRKRPLDTPKRMIKKREREGKREKER